MDEIRLRPKTTPHQPRTDLENHQAPEVYIAITPPGGIPARSGLTFGSADCTIQQILSSGVVALNFTKPVRNASTTAISGNDYIPVARDKFGTWFALGNAGDSNTPGGGSYCNLATLRDTDCVIASGPGDIQRTLLRWSDAQGKWVSTVPVAWAYGVGDLAFWFESGSYHMTLDGMELLNCGDGCFSGGAITGHGPHDPPSSCGGTGTGTGPLDSTECTGDSFAICVACGACDSLIDRILGNCCCPTIGLPSAFIATVDVINNLVDDAYDIFEGDYRIEYVDGSGWQIVPPRYSACTGEEITLTFTEMGGPGGCNASQSDQVNYYQFILTCGDLSITWTYPCFNEFRALVDEIQCCPFSLGPTYSQSPSNITLTLTGYGEDCPESTGTGGTGTGTGTTNPTGTGTTSPTGTGTSSATGTGTGTSGGNCDGCSTSINFQADLSGISTGTGSCGTCADYNGTLCLPWLAFCHWGAPTSVTSCTGAWNVDLTFNDPNWDFVIDTGLGTASYQLSSPINCSGLNVFTLVSDDSTSCDFPATMNINGGAC